MCSSLSWPHSAALGAGLLTSAEALGARRTLLRGGGAQMCSPPAGHFPACLQGLPPPGTPRQGPEICSHCCAFCTRHRTGFSSEAGHSAGPVTSAALVKCVKGNPSVFLDASQPCSRKGVSRLSSQLFRVSLHAQHWEVSPKLCTGVSLQWPRPCL